MIYNVIESDFVFLYNTNRNGKCINDNNTNEKRNERKEFLWIGCWK